MKLKCRELCNTVAVLDFTGPIVDDRYRDSLNQKLDEARSRGVRHIVIDIRGVPFMNCSGLGMILSLKRAWDGVGEFRVAGPSKRISYIVLLLRLRREFSCYPTLEEALVSLFLDEDGLCAA